MQLSQHHSDQQQAVFRALSDPTRRSILMGLSEEDMTITEIVDRHSVTRTAINKHLTILREGGLISVKKNGRERINALEPFALKSVDDWLQHFHQYWGEKLNKLKDVAEAEARAGNRKNA